MPCVNHVLEVLLVAKYLFCVPICIHFIQPLKSFKIVQLRVLVGFTSQELPYLRGG